MREEPSNSPLQVTMYRGVDHELPAEGLHQFIRTDRKPRDTGKNAAFNIAFNLVMEMQFNVQRIRRCSLFVTGSVELAKSFAKNRSLDYVACVEPMGQFRFVWSPTVYDSKTLVDDYEAKYLKAIQPWEAELHPELVSNLDLTWTDVAQISDQLRTRPRRGFSWSDLSLAERLKNRLSSLTGRGKTLAHRYQDSDLAAALASGNEVQLFDCPAGYWLKVIPTTNTSD